MKEYILIDDDSIITEDEMFQDWKLTNQADPQSFDSFVQDLLDSYIIRWRVRLTSALNHEAGPKSCRKEG
jgi:hypothetical protein